MAQGVGRPTASVGSRQQAELTVEVSSTFSSRYSGFTLPDVVMRIVHLVAGAGGMYCGSCLSGAALARALGEAGQDVLLVPAYTPLRTDEENVSTDRVVFGGLNVYLQQRSALFRRTPGFLDWLLDRPGLLRRLGGQTRPERLGPLAVSMLRGQQGRQQKELDKLADWLAEEVQPEVVHLSTALLVGVASTLAERLDVPVVCTLSGEDSFVEELPEPFRTEARDELRTRCAELAALVAPSGYYAEFMAEYLDVAPERITVIRRGLNLEGHATEPKAQRVPSAEEPIAIGYLSRICPTKGLHQLAEAFGLLLREPALPPIRLRAAGYLGRGDRAYFRQILRQLNRRGMTDGFEYVGELDREGKIAFLQSLDVLSIPATRPQSTGLAVLEGWANGTPAAVPDHGVFSELVAETGGGLLYEPNRPTQLAAALKQLVEDPTLACRCGQQAHQTVHRDYDIRRTAERTMELYSTLCSV